MDSESDVNSDIGNNVPNGNGENGAVITVPNIFLIAVLILMMIEKNVKSG